MINRILIALCSGLVAGAAGYFATWLFSDTPDIRIAVIIAVVMLVLTYRGR